MIFGKPVDSYQASNIDAPGGTNYYGFIGPHGAFYFMKEEVSGTSTAYTFSQGVSGSSYSTNWTNRASLTYATFDNIFKW